MKIYVAGKNGMVGSAITKAALLQNFEVVGKSSKELDLRIREGVFEELTSEKKLSIICGYINSTGKPPALPVD